MKTVAGENLFGVNGVTIYYGQEKDADIIWKGIVNVDDKIERDKLIDNLIKIMENNSQENGFFKSDDSLMITLFPSRKIKIDDKKLYYDFFDNLKENYGLKQQGKTDKSDDVLISKAIRKTLLNYFGSVCQNFSKRQSATTVYIDDNEEEIIPSIKDLKSKKLAACVELSGCAHNLWLMTGRKSYYIDSRQANFENSTDGHAFVIVDWKDKSVLYDLAQNVLKKYDINPINSIMNNEPFIVDGVEYISNKKLEL